MRGISHWLTTQWTWRSFRPRDSYYALRSYATGGHPAEVGSEAHWRDWLARLVEATAEVARVLKPSGSIFVNCGDKYNSSSHAMQGVSSQVAAQIGNRDRSAIRLPIVDGVPAKSLMLLPERYRIACVDQLGLTARAVIVWDKPNGLPESVTDRVRRSHEDWVHLTVGPRYYAATDELRSQLPPNAAGRTDLAPPSRAALGPELRAAVRTDDGPLDGRGWCDLGQSQVTVVLPVTVDAQRLQVVEPVGLKVVAEVPERDLVVDLKVVGSGSPLGATATDAAVSVSFKRCLASLGPVGATVAAASPAPSGAVLATDGLAPSDAAFRGAKATHLEVALSPGHGVAARVALTGLQGEATLLVWTSLAASHGRSLSRQSDRLGKLPGSVWSIPSEPLRLPGWLGVDHYAAFPSEWPRRLVLGWSPPGICCVCGEGRFPVVERGEFRQAGHGGSYAATEYIPNGRDQDVWHGTYSSSLRLTRDATILGYACLCCPSTLHPGTGEPSGENYETAIRDGRHPQNFGMAYGPNPGLSNRPKVGPWREWHLSGWQAPPTRPALVLDPFMGTGTTLGVARALDRHAIGVDLSHAYCRAARYRIFQSGDFGKVAARTNRERQGTLSYD